NTEYQYLIFDVSWKLKNETNNKTMGIIENSFKRELGKNTGKMVSNMIFGDKHSTPYRRVHSAPPPPPRPSKIQLEHEANLARIEAEKEIQRKMLQEQNKQHKAELELQERIYKEQQETEQEQFLEKYIIELQSSIREALDFNTDAPTLQQVNYLISVLETKKWANKLDFGSKSLEKNKNRLENELSDIYLMKLNECLEILSDDLSDIKRKYYFDTLQKFEKRKSEGLYGVIGANVGLLAKKAFNLIRGIKKTKEIEENHETNSEASASIPESSIFFDLNENNRISDNLAKIWSKYSNSVDKEIINRKPIFSADGVKDSLLFVGINPSYEPSDDEIFLKSNDEKSLLYGSLYQRDDAPDYFKSLEAFSERVERGYTHTNLLYARENDRDFLLRTNSDFIREQLELTYDTIEKIKPVAIFFFGAICRNLIFGADRWVNPKTEIDGRFILNGTEIPVFFTEDIAFLNESDKDKLLDKVRLAL
ncbi:MAG: hypothetical protein COS19_05185, partial [Flavobacteriaceae bacterium CG02_land_8_20_14_3_00_34_13]